MQSLTTEILTALRSNEREAVVSELIKFIVSKASHEHGDRLLEAFGFEIKFVEIYEKREPLWEKPWIELGDIDCSHFILTADSDPVGTKYAEFDSVADARAMALGLIIERHTAEEILENVIELEVSQ